MNFIVLAYSKRNWNEKYEYEMIFRQWHLLKWNYALKNIFSNDNVYLTKI
jgi:hypothetical protein